MRIATASVRTGLAMTWFLQGVRYRISGRTEASAPTGGYGGDWVQAAGWGHPALRSVTGSAVGRDDVGIVPYGCIQGVRGKWWIYRGLPGEGQREGNFWLNLGEGREVF